jgi:2'-5' RNA ligase
LVGEVELLVAALNMEVASIGLQTENRPYKPHITLARHARYLPNINFEPIVWRAESFCLVESCSEPSGVNYKVRQQWALI